MSLKNNPSSEDNNELNKKPDLDKQKQNQAQKETFQEASKLQETKNVRKKSAEDLGNLWKEILKSEVTVPEKLDYVEKMSETFTPNNNSEDFREHIASAHNLPEDQNNIAAVAESMAYSGKELILKPISIIIDFFKINDHKDLITRQAEHEWIKNA